MKFYKINDELTIDKNNISEIVSRPNNTVDICMKNGNCYNCHKTFEEIWNILNNGENEKEQTKKENKKWQPQSREEYWYIGDDGNIFTSLGYDIDTEWRISQGNVFETEEQAEQYLENLKTKAELRKLADELNGDIIFDWTSKNQPKWYILLDCETNKLLISHAYTVMGNGIIHCINPHFKDIAIERIGEQRIIDMIKAGV